MVFDIGSFASASESGFSLKLMQFASKSLDGLIHHMSAQKSYYEKFFPWIIDKSQFIKFGTDFDFFGNEKKVDPVSRKYIVCAGKNKCDWDTVVKAYKESKVDLDLHLIGGKEERFQNIDGIEQIPYLPINDFIEQVQGAEFCVLPLEPVPFSFGQMRLLQQMALRKCVIVSDAPSILDYVENNRTAMIYKSFDMNDLMRKMRLVNDDHNLKDNVSQNAFEYVKTNCNEQNMAKAIEKFLDEISDK